MLYELSVIMNIVMNKKADESSCPLAAQQNGGSMTSKQRAFLKSLASSLNPVFQVGKSSLTPELTAAIREAFNKNELIKIAVLKNCSDDPDEIALMVSERTHSQIVQVIGKKIVLYKPDAEHPKIDLASLSVKAPGTNSGATNLNRKTENSNAKNRHYGRNL